MIFLILFFLSSLFGEEIDFFSEKTYFKKDTFYFSEGLCFHTEDKVLSSKNGILTYPLLKVSNEVLFTSEDLSLLASSGNIDLSSKTATFFSPENVEIKNTSFKLFCKKAFLDSQNKKALLEEDVQLYFADAKILSQKISVVQKEKNKVITGNLKGYFNNETTFFTYNGDLLFDQEKNTLITQNEPFFLEDEKLKVSAKHAEFVLKEKNGLNRIVLSGTVTINSPQIQAVSDQVTYLASEKTYILKSLSKNNVLVFQEDGMMSAKEIHIKKDSTPPEIEGKGVVHFHFTDSENSYFKNLIKSNDKRTSTD